MVSFHHRCTLDGNGPIAHCTPATLAQNNFKHKPLWDTPPRFALRSYGQMYKLVVCSLLDDAVNALFALEFPHPAKYIFISLPVIRVDRFPDLLLRNRRAGNTSTKREEPFQ